MSTVWATHLFSVMLQVLTSKQETINESRSNKMSVRSKSLNESRLNSLVNPFTPLCFMTEAYWISNLGTDFKIGEELEIPKQVARLIDQATNLENLCQHYIGMLNTTNHAFPGLKFKTDWGYITI